MLGKVKKARRLTTSAFDDELEDLIAAAKADLKAIGITAEESDPLVSRAVVTYCLMNFGAPDNYDKLKASYDEQKAQMQMTTGYGFPKEDSEDGV